MIHPKHHQTVQKTKKHYATCIKLTYGTSKQSSVKLSPAEMIEVHGASYIRDTNDDNPHYYYII